MAIQSDSMGFLRGVPQDMGEMKRIWGGIQSDIRAIRAALELDSGSAAKARRVSVAAPQAQRAPVAGVSAARSSAAGKSSASPAVRNTMPAGMVKAMVAQAAAVSVGGRGGRSGGAASQAAGVQRDGRGRFVAGSGGGGAGGNSPAVDSGGTGSAISSGLGRIKDAIGELRPENEVDPTIKAFGEVAQPMARGYKALFGGAESKSDKSRDRWYRRFWGHMRRTSDDQARDTKAMRKSLKSINDKPTAAGGRGGLLGGLGSLIGGGGGALTALTGFAKAIGGGALKRIPLIGGLLAGIGGLFEVFDSESSDLSRAEKDKKTGGAVGGIGGALAGGLAGAKMGAALGMIGGPIGAAIGGVVGGAAGMFFGEQAGRVLGDTVGGWVTTLRDADIPGKIVAGWGAVTSGLALAGATLHEKAGEAFEFVQSTWAKVTKPISDLAERMKGVLGGFADALNEVIKEKFGVDVKAGLEQASQVVSQAKAKVSEVATKAVDAVADGAVKAGKYVQENTLIGKGATLMTESIKSMMGGKEQARWEGGAKNDIVGAAMGAGVDAGTLAKIARFESGFNSNAAPIASDKSRNKIKLFDGRMGLSSAHGYGQFLDGTWQGMLNKHGGKYGVANAGKLSKDEANALRGDTKLQAAMLAEFTKENIAKGRALGGADDDANVYAYHNLGDGDAARLLKGMKANPSMSVRDALVGGRAVDDKERARIESVISGNKSLYGDGGISASDAYGRMGAVMRAGDGYAADARNAVAVAQATRPPEAALAAVTAPATAVAVAPPSPVAAPAFVTAVQPTAGAAPKVPVQVASADAGAGRGFVNPALGEPGQDLQDRKLAHLVTGGIST